MQFSDLKLIEPILRAVAAEGYDVPTPIQEQAIPHVLEGRDLLGCAQTGTGKTAAFALPILQRLAEGAQSQAARRPIRVLVLTPTRELAAQIDESFATYGRHLRLRHTVIFGGVSQRPQEQALAAGPDILVATPGRLLDLCSQGKVSLRDLQIFVLDEADRMLDMGFIHDVRRIIALLPERRQTLFFSATMPPDIQELSARILVNPARVAVTPVASTAEKIRQSVCFVDGADKRALLERVLGDPAIKRALVFTRTKHGANRVAAQLARARIGAEAIHGNKSQNARERALASFKRGDTRVLVATDIAARGIDVEGISHVINFDLPEVPESYVHRIGRTARAGASGEALSFCNGEERPLLYAIERLIRMRIPVAADLGLPAGAGSLPAQPALYAQPAPRPQHAQPAPRPQHAQHAQHGPNGPRRQAPQPGRPAVRPLEEGSASREAPRPAEGARSSARSFSSRRERRYVTS
jgi:ATP-dependent RNA helicase RhlE